MIKVLPPKTNEEAVARERERKARTTLLMALPEDHLAEFHKIADAKKIWEAIKSRFGGNDESKKMKKHLLKQQFEGFSVSALEGLHKGYDRDGFEMASGHDFHEDQEVLQEDRLLNTQMNANDKFGLGYGDYRYGSILSYENEVLQSVFMYKECDLENTPVNDRYTEGMHAVPPLMTGNYMPFGPDVEIEYSKFTYGPKQTLADKSNSKSIEYASSDSDSSVETTTSMSAPVNNASKIVCEPKV
uniref:Xylulose kinase-1 n=1 Tax=Tanacetum cinerariifolium TaxID=118510 RepID=A0A6L2MID5_TANCI|nr:xylulose kinase-1 [Tanacetum cinerariifolium]